MADAFGQDLGVGLDDITAPSFIPTNSYAFTEYAEGSFLRVGVIGLEEEKGSGVFFDP
jgi:hypothetical protein